MAKEGDEWLRRYSGFKYRHPSKIINGRQKQSSGHYTLSSKKRNKVNCPVNTAVDGSKYDG